MKQITKIVVINLIFFLMLMANAGAQEDRRQLVNISELMARSWAVERVMPAYPPEALEGGATGVVVVRGAIDRRGAVWRVRVPPDINPLFRKSVVAAVKRWRFEYPPGAAMSAEKGYISLFRLSFSFTIEDGRGRVRLYNPPWESKAHERMRVDDHRALEEWDRWHDVTEEDSPLNDKPH